MCSPRQTFLQVAGDYLYMFPLASGTHDILYRAVCNPLTARSRIVQEPGHSLPTAWASSAQTEGCILGTPFNICPHGQSTQRTTIFYEKGSSVTWSDT